MTVTPLRPSKGGKGKKEISDNEIIQQNNLLGGLLQALLAVVVKMIKLHATLRLRKRSQSDK